jgi:hypothetical protein
MFIEPLRSESNMPVYTKPIGRLSPLPILIAFLSLPTLLSQPIFGAGVIDIQTEQLPRAIQGLEYSAGIRTSVDGRCPAGNVGLFLAGGSLPRGLRTTEEGLAGVPQEMGLFRFWIGARNTCSSTTRGFELLVTGRPILRAVPERIEFTIPADRPPESQSVLISSTWPDLPYSLSTPDDSWLKLRPARGATPEQGSALAGDRAMVMLDSGKLSPGVYHGTVIVSAWRADPISIEVTVTVPKPATAAAQ